MNGKEVSGIDPGDVFERLRASGVKWSQLDELEKIAEGNYKVVLNGLIVTNLREGVAKSNAMAEAMARSSDAYVKAYEDWVSARRKANDQRVAYDAAKSWFEAVRTKAANLRQEMKTLPYQK